MLDLELDFECEVHEKGEIKAMIELQYGKYKGMLITGGDDFSFKLLKIKQAAQEFEVINTYGARGAVLQISEVRTGLLAVSDNNIVQLWDLSRPGAYLKEVIHHED